MEDLIYLHVYFVVWLLPVMVLFFFRTLIRKKKSARGKAEKKKKENFLSRIAKKAGVEFDEHGRIIIRTEGPASSSPGQQEGFSAAGVYGRESMESEAAGHSAYGKHEKGHHHAERKREAYESLSEKNNSFYQQKSSEKKASAGAGYKSSETKPLKRGKSVFSSLDHLPPVKKAYLYSEIFGPPKGLN